MAIPLDMETILSLFGWMRRALILLLQEPQAIVIPDLVFNDNEKHSTITVTLEMTIAAIEFLFRIFFSQNTSS